VHPKMCLARKSFIERLLLMLIPNRQMESTVDNANQVECNVIFRSEKCALLQKPLLYL